MKLNCDSCEQQQQLTPLVLNVKKTTCRFVETVCWKKIFFTKENNCFSKNMLKVNLSYEARVDARVDAQDAAKTDSGCFGRASWSVVVHSCLTSVRSVFSTCISDQAPSKPQQLDFDEITNPVWQLNLCQCLYFTNFSYD